MGLLSFRSDLQVYISGADKPRKFTWKAFGEYLANEAFFASQEDLRAMKQNPNSEIFPKFLNNPIGVRMLSTAYYLWSNYKAISPLLKKSKADKNKENFFLGYAEGLKKLKDSKKNQVFTDKHISFITRYYRFLIQKTQEKSFNPGSSYTQSMYKFYKLTLENDPVIIQERTMKSQYMNKRLIDFNKRLNRKFTIRVL